jgi:aspartyl-tRNA(Asn)/glutamyl-tRNA(Gln) amidotransferase subunit B
MNIPFDAYETIIGFECHVQLSTASKLFSSGANKYKAAPNSLLDIVDAGLPGVLPVLNKRVVEFAVKLGVALNCEIHAKSIFARKHYFYPDLPKGYQISQFDRPICEHGVLTFMMDDQAKSLRIRRIHIEEDAGKSIHLEDSPTSYVDFNRAGTPLLEVVTEPDLRSAKEAMEAFKALRQIVIFLGICDGNMAEGSLRADVNVSVRRVGEHKLGTRTETKNLNSFRFLGQAIAFEARRQIIELETGKAIHQETRLWDPNTKESRSMRSKEEAHDYRYFPDPDLLPLSLPEGLLEEVSKSIPEMPHEKFKRYQEQFGLNSYDAQVLTSEQQLALYFEQAVKSYHNPKSIANWIINEVLRSTKDSLETDDNWGNFAAPVNAQSIANLVKLIDEGAISSSIGKRVYTILEKFPQKDPAEIIKENHWQMINDPTEIANFVKQVLKENHDEVQKYRQGKTKVFGFLMGQLMKLSKGNLDLKTANQLMLEALVHQNSDDGA